MGRYRGGIKERKDGKEKGREGKTEERGRGQVWLPASVARSASGPVKFAVVYRQLPVVVVVVVVVAHLYSASRSASNALIVPQRCEEMSL